MAPAGATRAITRERRSRCVDVDSGVVDLLSGKVNKERLEQLIKKKYGSKRPAAISAMAQCNYWHECLKIYCDV